MKYKQLLLGIVICIVFEFTIYIINHRYGLFKPFFSIERGLSQENHEGGGKLTNPLLECNNFDGEEGISQLNISKFELVDYVDKLTKSNNIEHISVYVRDLNNGPWIGINEKDDFIAGSLLKVPVLIAYMKSAQKDPFILDKKIELKSNDMSSYVQYFKQDKEVEVGKSYTLSELLEYSIYYSDNTAAEVLARDLTDEEIKDTFTAIGLGTPVNTVDYPVNTKTYAGFFRILFNASYLNKDYSEKTLELLTHTKFDKGITAKLPKDLVVAHKFGVREYNAIKQLHDCGIVYYPNHPYIICVMTRGDNLDELSRIIADISKFVYDQVSKIDTK